MAVSDVRDPLTESVLPHPELARHLETCGPCLIRWTRREELHRRRRAASGGRSESHVVYTSMLSPLGALWIAQSDRGLVAIDSAADELTFCRQIERRGLGSPDSVDHLTQVSEQLNSYFSGLRTAFDLQLDLRGLRPFTQAVLRAVHAIPCGTTQSYGDIAWAVGSPRAARAVGSSLAISPISIVIPCHRVIRGDGAIGEYGGPCGIPYKRALLAIEGAVIHDTRSGEGG